MPVATGCAGLPVLSVSVSGTSPAAPTGEDSARPDPAGTGSAEEAVAGVAGDAVWSLSPQGPVAEAGRAAVAWTMPSRVAVPRPRTV